MRDAKKHAQSHPRIGFEQTHIEEWNVKKSTHQKSSVYCERKINESKQAKTKQSDSRKKQEMDT